MHPTKGPLQHQRRLTHIPRSAREAESVRLVAVTRIKVVWVGIHLVLEDAIRGPTRCIADDEHAPAGNVVPDWASLVGSNSGDRPSRPAARSSPLPPTHRGHLQQFTDTPHQPALPILYRK